MFIFNLLMEDVQEVKDKVHQHFKKNWKRYAAGAAGAVALGGAAYGGHKLYNDHRIDNLKKDLRSDEAKEITKKKTDDAVDKGYKIAGKELEYYKKNPTEYKVQKTIKDFPNNVEYMKWKAQQLKNKVIGE
jgi:hypothetical protein